ncbi:hypothetical protein DIPPA_03974, partial [Diplonema papillatum]
MGGGVSVHAGVHVDPPWADKALKCGLQWRDEKEKNPLSVVESISIATQYTEGIEEISWVRLEEPFANKDETEGALKRLNDAYIRSYRPDGGKLSLELHRLLQAPVPEDERPAWEAQLNRFNANVQRQLYETLLKLDLRGDDWQDLGSDIRFLVQDDFLLVSSCDGSAFLRHILAVIKVANKAVRLLPMAPFQGVVVPYGCLFFCAGYSILCLAAPFAPLTVVPEVSGTVAGDALTDLVQEQLGINTVELCLASDADSVVHLLPGNLICEGMRDIRAELRHGKYRLVTVRNHILAASACLSDKLERRGDGATPDVMSQTEFVDALHFFGLSIRHLGCLFTLSLSRAVSELALVEMISRCGRSIWSREVTKRSGDDLLTATAELLMCRGSLWGETVTRAASMTFALDVSHINITPALRQRVWLRIAELCGVQFSNGKPTRLLPVFRSDGTQPIRKIPPVTVESVRALATAREKRGSPLFCLAPCYAALDRFGDAGAAASLAAVLSRITEQVNYGLSEPWDRNLVGLVMTDSAAKTKDWEMAKHAAELQAFRTRALCVALSLMIERREGLTDPAFYGQLRTTAHSREGNVYIARLLGEIGQILTETGEFEAAEELLCEAEELLRCSGLAFGAPSKAARTPPRSVVAALKQGSPAERSALLSAYNHYCTIKGNLGACMHAQGAGRLDEAIAMLRDTAGCTEDSLSLMEAAQLPATDNNLFQMSCRQVSTLNNLASLLFHKRTPQSWKEADEMYRTALEKQQRLEELHGDAAAEQVAEGRTETANNLRVLTNTRRKWAAVKLQATFRRFCARARCRRMREAHRCFPLLAVHAGDGGVEPRHDFFGAYRLRAPAAWLHGYPTWDMAEEAPDYDARVRARGGGGEPAAAAGSRECTVFPYCIARAAGRWCVGTELNRDMAFRQVLRSDREGAGSPADCTAYSVDGSHAARAPRRKTSTTALISEVPPTPRFTASSVVIQPLHHRLQALEAADRSAVARDEEAAAAQALDKARQGPRGRADKEKAQQARSVGTLEAYRRAQLEKDCLERFAMLLYQSEAARRELDLKRVVRKFEDLLEQAAEALGCDEFYILSDDSESEEGADRPPPATRKAEKKERAQVLAAAKDGARRIAAERAAAAEQLGVVADELRARVAAGRAEGALREAAAARLAGEKLAEALYGDEARTRGGLTAAEGSERDSLAAVSRNTLANTRAASEAVGLAVRDEEKGRAAVAAEEAGNRLENERDSAAVLSKNAVARAAAEAVREEGEGRAAVAGAEAKDRQGVDKAWHRGRAQCEKLALHGAAEARRRNDVARAEWSAREDMQEAVVQHRHGVAAAGLLRGEAAARADVAAAERTEHEAHAARRSETFQSHEPAAVGAGATRLLTEEAAMRLRAADRRDDAFHRICKQARAELREVVEAAVRQEEAQRALIHVEQAASAGGLTESLAGAACEADRRGMDRVKLDEIIERDNLRKSHAERLRALCASFDGETQARLLEQRCRQLGFTGDVRSPAALAAFRQGL